MLPAYSTTPSLNEPSPVPLVTKDTSAASEVKKPSLDFDAESLGKDQSVGFRRLSYGRVLLTLNQLAVLSQNGIEIAEALEIVAENCPDERLAESLIQIHDSVTSGHAFSSAVAMHGVHFPPTVAPMIAAASPPSDHRSYSLICTSVG